MSKYAKKLGSDQNYIRPKKTYQESLSMDEISEKLQGYEIVDNIQDIPLNTHIRYFIEQDGIRLFRTGGFLYNKKNADKYVILNNGKNTWSVQIEGTTFYRKLTHQEEIENLHELYGKKLQEKDKIIIKLKKQLNLISPKFGSKKSSNSSSSKSLSSKSLSKKYGSK
ncbi:hypothetical protein QLL95_gp1177 [Cotonvirus japonicus]|uniref:Uncharacterized protein n=1 Tax=Cotonvirus japonicus TaxID=2811091 RepID=A0ABM7NS62_9VIRU|nr:hypothetical protein QLL95_gp1177 [Cotonvirus japonicus]BCS82946.1 hypothetical protein [Cotonvirus japonicus]